MLFFISYTVPGLKLRYKNYGASIKAVLQPASAKPVRPIERNRNIALALMFFFCKCMCMSIKNKIQIFITSIPYVFEKKTF